MQGNIIIFDQPEGPLKPLAAKLGESGFHVVVRHSQDEVLTAVPAEQSQLLIAMGAMGTSASMAEKLYDAVSIPIMLVLSTAGEETMTFLRRHPGVIGVYYTPLNLEKFLERVRQFFRLSSPS